MKNTVLVIVFVLLTLLSGCKEEAKNITPEAIEVTPEIIEHETFNHLKGESNPYLQKYAQNPVDWYLTVMKRLIKL